MHCLKRYDYLERNCCGSDVFDPSISAPTCESVDPPDGDETMVVVIASVAAVAALGLFCFVARRWSMKKKDKKSKIAEKEPVLQLPAKSPGRPGKGKAQPKEAYVATAVPVQEVEN